MAMRSIDELEESAQQVLERAYVAGAYTMTPLFSGGHDSLCAVHLASQHRAFRGVVHHIDTGIGAAYTRAFVERVCSKFGWTLKVWKEVKETYEKIVSDHGFPGPAGHQYVYNRLKDRCVYKITKGKQWKMLVSGARSQESQRRMGHAVAVRIGERGKDGTLRNRKRVWTAPCHDWSKAEQMAYMDEFGLPINRLKVLTGMSRECNCGAFAEPGELETIREHIPDVAAEIDRLTGIAKACGKPCVWGQRPPGQKAIAETGPMCSSCDRRAAASGLMVLDSVDNPPEMPIQSP